MAIGHKEFRIAAAIAKMLWAILPKDALIWHTPNETGGIGKRRGAQNKRLGVRPGVPDYFILWRGNLYALEVKTPEGRLSKTQEAFRLSLEEAGGKYAVVRSTIEAYSVVASWGMLDK